MIVYTYSEDDAGGSLVLPMKDNEPQAYMLLEEFKEKLLNVELDENDVVTVELATALL